MDPPEELRGSSRVCHAQPQQYDKSSPLNFFKETCVNTKHVILSSHPLFFFFFFCLFVFCKSRKHSRDALEKKHGHEYKTAALEFEVATLNSSYQQKEKRDMTQSAPSNHKWTRSYIASFYFRILISESRVSDSSCLGKAGVAPGFVVLSDTVFRNNSQQCGLERGLKCHGKWCHMSNQISSVSPHLNC